MNNIQFIDVIKIAVREAAVESVIDNLQDPPGRLSSHKEQEVSLWFQSLSTEDRARVSQIVAEAVDEAIFGFLSVLDGTRAIESGEDKGRLNLTYSKKDSEILLNDEGDVFLHDLY